MTQFRYFSPVEIRFGFGSRAQLLQALQQMGAKPFFVVDSFLRESVLVRDLLLQSEVTAQNIFSNVEPNPSLTTVQSIADAALASGCNALVAIGGGSVMDAAKAAALAAGTRTPIASFLRGETPLQGGALPTVAMPTTAGTGSEVTMVSVLTDTERDIKAPLAHPCLFPRLAIVDPEFTLSVPPQVTAATGMDALSHALEGYWSVHHQPFCDAFAENAASLVFRHLADAVRNGEDREAREAMALASLMAGLAFAQPKTAAVHACSYVLTQRYGLSHGAACALTLDAFVRFNAEEHTLRMDAFARALGLSCSNALANKIHALKAEIGMPMSLADAGIPMDELDTLVRESFHPNMLNNPRKVTSGELKELYLSLK
jgi:alcohol dehydrogenase class IV